MEGATAGNGVRVVSRRMVLPLPPPPTTMVNGDNGCHPHPSTANGNGNGCNRRKEEDVEVIHLTPWDLRLISIDYIQKGILLPKPPSMADNDLINALESSFALALRLFYPFAGRLASEEHADDGTVSVFLRCTGEGAEFVHAAAPEVAVADIVASLYTPPVVWDFYPLPLVLGADAAIERLPVLAVQVTVLADGVFIGMTLNHCVGDGTAFWHFFNTRSEINRAAGGGMGIGADLPADLSTPPPVFKRWLPETCPVPIPMPFSKLEHIVRRFERTPVKECFFTFSAASVKKLKARANDEMAGSATATATISSLQAHFWRAVCRARRLPPEHGTFYSVVVGCRGRVNGIPPGYVGNAMVFGRAEATAGEIEEKGLGWTAWLLNRAVASFDEATMREALERWVREPDFTYMDNLSSAGTALVTGSSPRSDDVFGNDFGWGKPLAVRSGAGNKADGKATVFEGPERGGSISLEVCIAPDALKRLVVADDEFMDTALPAATYTGEIQARCYTAASVPQEKLIMGRTLTGLGVNLELTNPRGKVYRRVQVQAHVTSDAAADIRIAYEQAMQLGVKISRCLNLDDGDVMFMENQFLVTAQGVVKIRQSSVNKAAHKLAKRARQSILSQECSFTCNAENHLGSPCRVLETIRRNHHQWGDYSLISVRCF